MSSKRKVIKGHLPAKVNGNFIATNRGQREYDYEINRLQENRRRLAQFIKSKPKPIDKGSVLP